MDMDFGPPSRGGSPIIRFDVDPGFRESNHERLLSSTPNVIEVNEFDERSVKDFEKALTTAMQGDQGVIPVVIDSYGGDVHSLMRMVDLVRVAQARGHVIPTVAMGKAMSCGAVLLAAGDAGYRYATTETVIMIHEVSSMTGGKSTDMVVDAAFTEALTRRLYAILDTACEQESGYWAARVAANKNADLFLTAREALKSGLISSIGLPTLKVSARIDFEWIKP